MVTKLIRRPITIPLLLFALEDDAVARILRLVVKGSNDWVGLYRVLDAIGGEVGGWNKIAKRGWATAAAIERFKRTSCSPSAAGDAARHGKEVGAPPRNPMKLEDAQYFVRDIAIQWLQEKYGRQI
jgi:hypothetical protein